MQREGSPLLCFGGRWKDKQGLVVLIGLLLLGPHPSRLNRLASDISPRDGAANDALTANFFDLNEASFQVLVKASPGARLERLNLIDGEVSMLKSILSSDDGLLMGGGVWHFYLRDALKNQRIHWRMGPYVCAL